MVRKPPWGEKTAVTASMSRDSRDSKPETNRAGRSRRVTEQRADHFLRNLPNLDMETSLIAGEEDCYQNTDRVFN
jgi:hypothetical protein